MDPYLITDDEPNWLHVPYSKAYIAILACLQRMFSLFDNLSSRVYHKLSRTIPGFDVILEKVHAEAAQRDAIRAEKRAAQKKAEKEKALYGRSGKWGNDL